MNTSQKIIKKELRCGVCSSVVAIPRRQAKNRKSGHNKHMYCFRCNKIQKFVELSEGGMSYGYSY